MARSLTLVAAICALAAGTAYAAALHSAHAAAVVCGPSSAHTLVSGSRARVYSQGGSVYGCAAGGTVDVKLGGAIICLGIAGRAGPAIALAGTLVAYSLERCGVDTGSSSILIRRLTDGRLRYRQSAWTLGIGPESYVTVGSIVVNRAGNVAWIASAASIIRHGHGIEVAENSGAGVRRLDSGTGIVTGSLRLRGSRLTWLHGRATRSAKLG